MKSSNKSSLIKFVVLLVLFICFTILVKVINVDSIGPNGSEVGFSNINKSFHDLLPYNEMFYNISKYLGYLSFGIIALYGLTGLIQLIKKKSLAKVDKELLILGGFYVVVLVVYFLFEKVVINYRPVLEKGALEASYPSSHTILSICVCLSSIMVASRIFKNKDFVKWFNVCTSLLMVGIVVTRLLSGVHWLTDIFGGILISLALCMLFHYLIGFVPKNKKSS